MLLDRLADGRDDFVIGAEQIVAAHAGLAGKSGGDDDDIRARDIGIGVGALEFGVEAFDGGGLRDVERLTLRQALHDVEQDGVAELLQADQMRERAADLATADQRDFVAGHGRTPVRRGRWG